MPEVEFPANGSPAHGYLAVPDGGSGPGVVVLHEWWGLDDSMRGMCDEMAAAGIVALAPDLYDGDTTTQPDEAEQKMMAMNMDKAEAEMRGAVQFLADQDATTGPGIGSVGFCLGGGLSIWAAATNPDQIKAAVTYYYVMPHGKPDFSKIDGPVLGHFGTEDDFVPVDDAKELAQEMRDAGVEVEFEFYEGCGHAFSNAHNRMETYDRQAAEDAWKKTTSFFLDHLSQ
ncbi:MAG: dienelactone hydrolase family protein [Solirubrobacterales bacterium]